MNEDLTPQNSVIESDHSRSSEVALIGNLFPKVGGSLDINSRDRKYSRKYNVTEDHIEEERQSFKWIPEQTRPSEEPKKASQRRATLTRVDPPMSTLESDKTSSSCTASDFTSNVYTKNGYIRGTNNRPGQESNPMFRHNELSSLISSLGTGRNFPVEIKPDDKEASKEQKCPCLGEEHSLFLALGGIQMMLGILMAVFGVLVLAHDSSLSSSGCGLWGGAVAMFSGLSGILAGLKGCYAYKKHMKKAPRTLLTIFLALCLVSFALSNLVVVLTITGLIRDVRRPKFENGAIEKDALEENLINWPPVLADLGLILAAALQCIAAVLSGCKCYKEVCPCLRGNRNRFSETGSQIEKYKSDSKERLVNHWLGQQFRISNKKNKCDGQSNLIPWGTPNIMLLPPPPPMITNGQIPILTFLQAPSSVFGSGPLYSGSMPCCCRYENCYVTTPHPRVHEKRASRKLNYIEPDNKDLVRTKNRNAKRERRSSLPTAEEVARTYTGLDREIAEEFIAVAMESGRTSRHASFADFANNY